jgi:hypothetical protein
LLSKGRSPPTSSQILTTPSSPADASSLGS